MGRRQSVPVHDRAAGDRDTEYGLPPARWPEQCHAQHLHAAGRGAAKIIAAELKDTPVAGLEVQLCGDAHLANFGLFGRRTDPAIRPERRATGSGAVRWRA